MAAVVDECRREPTGNEESRTHPGKLRLFVPETVWILLSKK